VARTAAGQACVQAAEAGRGRADAGYQGLGAQTGGREHMSDTAQAVAALLSHQQTADLTSARQM